MELSPRLQKIASLVPVGTSLADVGTDHGYIPLYLFENSVIDRAIAMDVNPMPLERARINLTNSGHENKCEFRLSDGLEKLSVGEADVIVIAGMGGLLIRDILSRGKSVLTDKTKLLLQPMIAPSELREFLYTGGFCIYDEYVVREENKFYNIISAGLGNTQYNDDDIYIGRNLEKNSPGVFDEYINYKLRVCGDIIDGMQKAKNADISEIDKYKKQYAIYKKQKREG